MMVTMWSVLVSAMWMPKVPTYTPAARPVGFTVTVSVSDCAGDTAAPEALALSQPVPRAMATLLLTVRRRLEGFETCTDWGAGAVLPATKIRPVVESVASGVAVEGSTVSATSTDWVALAMPDGLKSTRPKYLPAATEACLARVGTWAGVARSGER